MISDYLKIFSNIFTYNELYFLLLSLTTIYLSKNNKIMLLTNILSFILLFYTVVSGNSITSFYIFIFFTQSTNICYITHSYFQRIILFITFLSPFFFMAPFIFISNHSYGPRNYITTSIFFIFLVCWYFSKAYTLHFSQIIKACFHKLIILSALISVCFIFSVFFPIGQTKRAQMQIISTTDFNATSKIVLPAFPHAEYLWHPLPSTEERIDYFKRFYGIPENVIIYFQVRN